MLVKIDCTIYNKCTNIADFVLHWHTAITKPANQYDFKGKNSNEATTYTNGKPVDKIFDHEL